MKSYLLMMVMCIMAFHVVAQVGGERKSHFTAQGYMSMCFSQKKHVWSEYLSCNMGGGAALSCYISLCHEKG